MVVDRCSTRKSSWSKESFRKSFAWVMNMGVGRDKEVAVQRLSASPQRNCDESVTSSDILLTGGKGLWGKGL